MNKCEYCKKNKGELWWNVMLVCQECYIRLVERKLEKGVKKNG